MINWRELLPRVRFVHVRLSFILSNLEKIRLLVQAQNCTGPTIWLCASTAAVLRRSSNVSMAIVSAVKIRILDELWHKALESFRRPSVERRILAATHGRIAEQGRLRQAGPGEVLDQPTARITMRATAWNALWLHSQACCQSETVGSD